MEENFFCLNCGAMKKGVSEGGIFEDDCLECGKNTFFARNPDIWLCVGEGEHKAIFVPMRDNSNNNWVELYRSEKEYMKLVYTLTGQDDVRIVEWKSDNTFKYIRNGYDFEMSYVTNVDCWIDPWWDGEEFISFKIVEKNHPDFEIYKKELTGICRILDLSLQIPDYSEWPPDLMAKLCSASSGSSSENKADKIILPFPKAQKIVEPKGMDNDYAKDLICPRCKSENVQLFIIVETIKKRKNKIAFGCFAAVLIFMFIWAFLAGEENVFNIIFMSVFWGLPISLIVRVIPWKISDRVKHHFVCNDCGRKFSKFNSSKENKKS